MNKNIVKILMVSAVAGLFSACTYDPYKTDIPKTEEKLSLSASAESVVITEEHLSDVLLSYNWTPARSLPDEYQLTYSAQLDVVGNNFGAETVISSGTGFEFEYDESTGMFSCSFTGEQLNNWYNDRWKLPVNADFSLEFRVVATWEGGPTYEMPEVRQVTVKVTPIQVIIFAADKMSIGGNAISTETEINPTLENSNVYAWYGALTAGDLLIPVEYDGVNYYIHPASGDGSLKDGQADPVVMDQTETPWKITEAGNYRVVINMEDKTATIYSAATDLQPKVVEFYPNGVDTNPLATMEVTNLFAYGSGTGWGWKNLNLTQSLADPQVFVYSGEALSGNMKFGLTNGEFTAGDQTFNQNNCYCYTCPLKEDGTRQDASIQADKLEVLHGGSDGETRNSYMGIPSGTTFIIFDLRNMTIYASAR